jgi:hypothetical protein
VAFAPDGQRVTYLQEELMSQGNLNTIKRNSQAGYVVVVLSALAITLAPPRAHAATTCPGRITVGSFTLTQNYDISTSPSTGCFEMAGTASPWVNLDLAGFKITCTGPGACAGGAVVANTASLVRVVDSSLGNTGGIFGPWVIGVRNAFVSYVNIDGAGFGVVNDNCPSSGNLCRVQNSVITNSATEAIQAWSPHGPIQHNFIDGVGLSAINTVNAHQAIEVQRNFIRGYGLSGVVADSSVPTVNGHDNVIDRGQPGSVPCSGCPASWTTSRNICEDAASCPEPYARFVLP